MNEFSKSHCFSFSAEKKKAGLFEQITKTHGTIIGITSGIVLVLLIISILVQVKQPRKKVMACKTAFNKTGFQEVFDPPHYELFSLRDKEMSADLADLSEEQIQQAEPDLLLVCLGAPRQELWMARYAGRLTVGLMVGLGGALDVYAGCVSRAPKIWRNLGFEWLYRLLRQPQRLKRMKCLPAFLWAAVKERNRSRL